MLCKKVVNFFSLLSQTHEAGARRMGITQELLSLVTGLAHYLKILIRISLTGALKLERDHYNSKAMSHFLARLDRLARDPTAHTASVPLKSPTTPSSSTSNSRLPASDHTNGLDAPSIGQTRTYGYKSLARAVGTLVGQGEATTDLCSACGLSIEEECARFGTSRRWHLACLRCSTCTRQTTRDRAPSTLPPSESPSLSTPRSLPLREFLIDDNGRIVCSGCNPGGQGFKPAFEYVTRLEQYAYLLCVALNKLYALLKQRGVVPSSPSKSRKTTTLMMCSSTELNALFTANNGDRPLSVASDDQRSIYDTYRDSNDIKRMKSVALDRKLSTTARVPKRSMVVESPSGRVAQHSEPQSAQPRASSSEIREVPRKPPSSAPVSATSSRDRPAQSSRPQSPPSSAGALASPQGLAKRLPSRELEPRPTLARTTTAVRIVDEHGPDSALIAGDAIDSEGITLADLPGVMEAERAREQRGLPSAPPPHVKFLSELSALEFFIVKHVAALELASEPQLKDAAPLEELLELIDSRKNTFWGKLFKGGGNDRKNVKKKGEIRFPYEYVNGY
jgi:hypothetical protein